MKNIKILIFICLMTAVPYLILSCSNSTGPSNQYDFPDPIDAVATDITLYVYSDIYGAFQSGTKLSNSTIVTAPVIRIILDTIDMATESDITIDINEADPYTDPPKYFIYAEADGFYTELYYCSKGETITVDLDAVPEVPNSITGVLFYAPAHDKDEYFAASTVNLTDSAGFSISTTTDAQGRFGFGNLREGEFEIIFGADGAINVHQIFNLATIDYVEYIFYEPTMDRAPYIYLYPETQIDISVELGLISGGQIVESEPPYNKGWNVNVTPNGRINNKFEYLYYESLQSVPLDYRHGWVLDGSDLENELRNLLAGLGFIKKEIDDFIKFWIPNLGHADYYAVYPQDIGSFVTLNITPQPDNILRSLLLIRPLVYKIDIPAPPEPETFIRDGFAVAEWGVIFMGRISR